MKIFIGGLAAIVTAGSLAGCSGSTPSFMTPSKPRSASEDPTMDPWERVGTQLKEKQSSAPVAAVPSAAPQPTAAPAPVAPAPKTAQ